MLLIFYSAGNVTTRHLNMESIITDPDAIDDSGETPDNDVIAEPDTDPPPAYSDIFHISSNFHTQPKNTERLPTYSEATRQESSL